MKLTRRSFLSTTAMASVGAIMGVSMPLAANAKTVQYSSETFNQYLASGEVFLMAIHAKWCSTCARQNRVINALRSEGEPYNSMKLLAVDWDENRSSSLIEEYNVPRRSTLIMFKGGKEIGRVVAGTSTSQIQGLIDKAY